jgi:hypothetical protein
LYIYKYALAESASIAGELIKCHEVDTRLLRLFVYLKELVTFVRSGFCFPASPQASQDIPRVLWNSLLLFSQQRANEPVPRHLNPVNTLYSVSLKSILILSFILHLGFLIIFSSFKFKSRKCINRRTDYEGPEGE